MWNPIPPHVVHERLGLDQVELVVLDAEDEGSPLGVREEGGRLRGVVAVANSDAVGRAGDLHAGADDAARVRIRRLLELLVVDGERKSSALHVHVTPSFCAASRRHHGLDRQWRLRNER